MAGGMPNMGGGMQSMAGGMGMQGMPGAGMHPGMMGPQGNVISRN